MAKNIIKEIIIVLLLAIAIILILGVLLYDYVPVNKPIPETISYTTPEKAKKELETDTNVEDMEVVVTYEIDSTDLNNYKRIQEYVPGKKNPFSSIIEEPNTTIDGENSNTSGSKTNNENSNTVNDKSNNNDTSNENTGYLPDKGTK